MRRSVISCMLLAATIRCSLAFPTRPTARVLVRSAGTTNQRSGYFTALSASISRDFKPSSTNPSRRPFQRNMALLATPSAGVPDATSVSTPSSLQPPPPAEKIDHWVTFGAVDDENRGDLAMDPPRLLPDPYFWMRDDDRTDPKVLERLALENAHAVAATAHLSDFRDELYAELKGHVKETDDSAPVAKGEWEYFTRTLDGQGYAIHCRRPRTEDSASVQGAPKDGEEIILDENVLAARNKESSFTSVGDLAVSPSQNLLAYSIDTSGSETFDLVVKKLQSVSGAGEKAGDKDYAEEEIDRVCEIDSGVEWGNDDTTLYYLKMDEAHRPYQAWRHTVGTPVADDELLFEEPNELFWVGLSKTLDGQYILIDSASKESSEVLAVDLSSSSEQPSKNPAVVLAPRRPKVLYDVDHRLGHWFIVTNEHGAGNFKLMTSPVHKGGSPEHWVPLVQAEPKTIADDGESDALPFSNGQDVTPGALMIEEIECFKDFVAISGRMGGYTKVWVLNLEGSTNSATTTAADASTATFAAATVVAPVVTDWHAVAFEDDACECGVGDNLEFDPPRGALRLSYSSLVAPPSVLDYAVQARTLNLVKQKEVPNYDPSLYTTARLEVAASDGALVPISLVFHKALLEGGENADSSSGGDGGNRPVKLPKPAPLHLYGYGSYGASMDPSFSASHLPLLNRGVVYAIAHVRGGAEMGRAWYEKQGKYLAKRNTFSDFVSCAEALHEHGWSTPQLTSTEGRSAGGLLMGAILNDRPDLFRVAVAGVPFVDVMTTMCDPSIPLTVVEWEEWGNPNEAKYFAYMKSYSPLNNVVKQAYPAILVTAGLHDPRVQYWEPLKWVAQLREHKTDAEPLLLKVDMEAGHFSASDRYKYLKEAAFDYAFLLDQLGLKDKAKL